MVAEKNGTIRFYDLITQQAILSLECEQTPLMSADWCLKNTLKIGAVAGNDWLIWDITCSRYFYVQDMYFFRISLSSPRSNGATLVKYQLNAQCITPPFQ